jgi:hypothetical protein
LGFESSPDSDDEDWGTDEPFSSPGSKILTLPLKELVAQFHIDAVSEDAQNALTQLYHSEEVQAADSFRQQILPAAKYMRSDGVMIPFAEIGTLFHAQSIEQRLAASAMRGQGTLLENPLTSSHQGAAVFQLPNGSVSTNQNSNLGDKLRRDSMEVRPECAHRVSNGIPGLR